MGLDHNMVHAGALMASPHWTEQIITSPQPDDLVTLNVIYP